MGFDWDDVYEQIDRILRGTPGAPPLPSHSEVDKSGAATGAQRFHVPIRFETTGAMERRRQNLPELKLNHAAATAAVPSHGSSGPLGISIPDFIKSRRQFEIGIKSLGLKSAEEAVADAEQRLKRWQDAVKVLEQLASIPHDPTAHVVAIVCDRVPRSPNPDPNLFG
jgi:hypothetical protein